MNKQQGFTLIELIIVIVILGILAVTAAPKFIDVQGDAQKSVINGLKGALESAAAQAHAKALIGGLTKDEYDEENDKTITVEGGSVVLDYGYPASFKSNIANFVTIPDGYVSFQDNATDTSVTETRIWPPGMAGDAADATLGGTDDTPKNCYVSYSYDGTGTNKPTITVVTTEC